MSETQRWTPRDDEETAVDQWARRLEGAVTADDVTAEALAEEIGDVPEEYAREVWQRAFDRAINATDRSEFHLSDFVEAHEALEGGMLDPNRSGDQDVVDDADAPDRADQGDAEADDELAQLKADVRDDDEDANAPQGSTGDSDTSAGGDSPETRCPEDGGDADEAGEPAPAEMDRDELEAEVAELRSDLKDVQGRLGAMQGKVNRLIQLCLGDTDGLATHDVGSMDDYLSRLQDLDERVTEHDDQLQMVRVDGGAGRDEPDDRARRIRQTLYRKRNDDGLAEMTRDEVDSRLGGGLHRDTVLDAMKRAADGHAAEQDDRTYTPINGSCDLQPLDCIRFKTGEARGDQSKVVLDLDDATGADIRQNLTTNNTGGDR